MLTVEAQKRLTCVSALERRYIPASVPVTFITVLQAIPMLVSVLVSGQQARMGNPGPVVLEKQQTQMMHPSFPGFAPPGASPAHAAQGAPPAQQARAGDAAPAAAAPGTQQMHVPTFVVNAGQPNEVRAMFWICRLGAGAMLQNDQNWPVC